jgi:nucleotide-binding universal stress UspA family protein
MEGLPILLCTNGCDAAQPALDYGVWLAQTLEAPVKLLGIVEQRDQQACVAAAISETAEKLEGLGLDTTSQTDSGRGSVVIARHAAAGRFLTVFGPLGRPRWRQVLQGRSFRRILARVETPLLYAPRNPQGLKHLLICLGGLEYADNMEHLGIHLARRTGARVTLLHVVEPVTLHYPTAEEIQHNWRSVLETDTPQGRNLRTALAEVQNAGLSVDFKVRHGNVVHEILDEIHGGKYDLVGMGSPYSAHSLRHLYLPNVTAEVAEAADSPVLTVRSGSIASAE